MRGVSLEEISAATRIAPRLLVAWENEQWDPLPGGVFNRGCIRAVARFLGLDEDSLVSEYALETKGRAEPGVVADPPLEQNSRYMEITLVIVLALLLIAGAVFALVHFGPQLAARWHKHSAQSATSPQPAPGDSH